MFGVSRTFYFHCGKFQNLFHPRLYYFTKKPFVNIDRRTTPDSRKLNRLVIHNCRFVCETVFHFRPFRLICQNSKTLTNIICDFFPGDTDNSCVADSALFKNREIRRAAADIQQRHTDFFFFIVQNRIARCKRFKHHIINMETGALNAFIYILCCRYKSGNDVNNSFHPHTGHSNGIINSILSINNKLLRDHVNNFSVEWKRDSFCVFDQPINVFLSDFILRSADADNAATLKALDMIARDANRYGSDLHSGLLFGILHRCLNGANSFFNVRYHTARQSF